jgi:hypothetical protein
VEEKLLSSKLYKYQDLEHTIWIKGKRMLGYHLERGVELTLSLVEVRELQAQECMIQLLNQRDINLVRPSELRQVALSADQELLLMLVLELTKEEMVSLSATQRMWNKTLALVAQLTVSLEVKDLLLDQDNTVLRMT